MGFLSRLRSASSAGSTPSSGSTTTISPSHSSSNRAKSVVSSNSRSQHSPPRSIAAATSASYSSYPSSRINQLAEDQSRRSVERFIASQADALHKPSQSSTVSGRWNTLRTSSSAVDLNVQVFGHSHYNGSVSNLHSTEIKYPWERRNSTVKKKPDNGGPTTAANKRISRLRAKLVNTTRPLSPPTKIPTSISSAPQSMARQRPTTEVTADMLTVADFEGRTDLGRIVEALCPPPIGLTADAFEERVDLVRGLVGTALRKKDKWVTVDSVFQTLELKLDRHLRALLTQGWTTENTILLLRLPLVFALSRYLCGASSLASGMRPFTSAPDHNKDPVYHPAIGSFNCIDDIIGIVKSPLSPVQQTRHVEPAHLLYPSTQSVPIQHHRSRSTLVPRDSPELPRNPLATGGRPPPLRPLRAKRTSVAMPTSETSSVVAVAASDDPANFRSVDRLPVPSKSSLRMARPHTSPSRIPAEPQEVLKAGGSGSFWKSSADTDGHSHGGCISHGETTADSAKSREYVTASSSLRRFPLTCQGA